MLKQADVTENSPVHGSGVFSWETLQIYSFVVGFRHARSKNNHPRFHHRRMSGIMMETEIRCSASARYFLLRVCGGDLFIQWNSGALYITKKKERKRRMSI